MWLKIGCQCQAKMPWSKIADLGLKRAASSWELRPTVARVRELPDEPRSTRRKRNIAPILVQMEPESS
jgi:hypothetical protein